MLRRQWLLVLLFLVLVPSALAAGCGDFQDVSTVIDLRVLDIRADPPEILVDPMNLGGPFSTRLTALIGDPTGGDRTVTVEALACPRTIDAVTAATGKNGIVCSPYDPQSTAADASVPVTAPPPAPPTVAERTAFGDAELTLPFSFPQELLVRAYQLDSYARLGFQLPIAFQLAVAAGGESEIAVKRVIFAVPPDGHADQTPNANPRIPALVSYADRDSDANPVMPQPFDLDQAMPVALGDSLWLEPQGVDSEAETYFRRALTREAVPQIVVTEAKETLRYNFYATAGTFSPPNTASIVSVVRSMPQRVHVESQYQAPAVMPPDSVVTFWIVVRDERGGSSWVKGRLMLSAP
jgi:hypothetical protein